MKKKLVAIMLTLALAAGLAACGGGSDGGSTTDDGSAATDDAGTEATDEGEGGEDEGETAGGGTAASGDVAHMDWTPYDEFIASIKATTDTVEREAMLHQAEDMLMETGAIYPIYYYNDIYLQRPEVDNIYSNLYGFKYFMFATAPDTTLKLNLASEPDHLDPALNSSVDGACLAVNSFSGLFTYNDQGQLVPDVASDDYTVSEDGLTYTINLLPDLKWSDGSPLTAEDFVYSWNRAIAEETAADYAYMFDAIARNEDNTLNVVASEDGQTLTITLNAPCAYMLDLLAFPAYYPVPKEAVEAANADGTNPGAWCQEAGFISNGAYTCTEWVHDASMVYTKNPNYHRADEVKVERLEFMLSADDTAIYGAYKAGDLDFADTVPSNEIQSLLNNPEFHIIDNLGTYYVSFNVKSNLFAGKTVEQANAMRRAFALLIDRDYIVENVGQTGQQPANTFVPAGMADGNGGEFRANDAAYTYPDEEHTGYFNPTLTDENTEEAIALLESAGYVFEDGMLSADTPLSFEYLTNEGTGHEAIAEAIQQDLAAIGIEMTIRTCDWNVFLDERKSGNYDVARNGWLADFNDPINFLEMWTTDSGNNDCQFGR